MNKHFLFSLSKISSLSTQLVCATALIVTPAFAGKDGPAADDAEAAQMTKAVPTATTTTTTTSVTEGGEGGEGQESTKAVAVQLIHSFQDSMASFMDATSRCARSDVDAHDLQRMVTEGRTILLNWYCPQFGKMVAHTTQGLSLDRAGLVSSEIFCMFANLTIAKHTLHIDPRTFQNEYGGELSNVPLPEDLETLKTLLRKARSRICNINDGRISTLLNIINSEEESLS